MDFRIFGIRHHGPGSAKNLQTALAAYQPDALLIEGPPDANLLIKYVENNQLKPPVAILTYNPSHLRQASYFPFAEFSPEWVAMKFALKQKIAVEFMDLPQAFHFAMDDDAAETEDSQQLSLDFEAQPTETPSDEALQRDPLGYLANLAGFEDRERWWEVTFEQTETSEAIFPAILEMMTALREAANQPLPPREALREAFMRKTIRAALKKHERVAVVCGAWHSPALNALNDIKASADNALLKGLKKIKTVSTWIPWTYERLSYQSGYGAGVISPAWYKMLFNHRNEVVVRWMTAVSRLFRKEDLEASSAHAIEGVRLAETLATLRGLPLAGIEELSEAAQTVFCGGYDAPMEVIREQLIIGDAMGKVPKEVPAVPLQDDLENMVKKTRLSKEYQSVESTTKELDLRKETNMLASLLLHRLDILGIDWGKKQGVRGQKSGSFHEHWKLRWKVGFAIAIIEAGMWGNTVETAAAQFILNKARTADDLSVLSDCVDSAIEADLRQALPELVHRLRNQSAITTDVLELMRSVPKLVVKIRYGTVRKADLSGIEAVVLEMLPRIFIGLPSACQSLNETAAAAVFKHLQDLNRAIAILNQPEILINWHATLLRLTNSTTVNGILSGGCTRILFEKQVFTIEKTVEKMGFALSMGNDPTKAGEWLEGFLAGSGLLLIHQPTLWNILDSWVEQLAFEHFSSVLPILRRTFSNFDATERQKMMEMAKKGQIKTTADTAEFALDWQRAEIVLPTVRTLLGL